MALQYILNNRGNPMLKYKGFLHYKDRTVDNRIYWKCEKYQSLKCRGRVISEGDSVKHFIEHTHAGDALDIEKRIAI